MTNRRMYELIENAPKTGKSPTIWAWPQLTEYLKTAAQPVAGPVAAAPGTAARPERRGPARRGPRPARRTPGRAPGTGRPLAAGTTGSAGEGIAPMYPSRFRYAAPRTLDEAIALLAEYGDDAKVLAGGQSLVPLLKLRFAAPALLVDINNLPGLDHHREDGDGTLRVGALCRHADLERSTLLPGKHPLMASAAPLVADPIVRNRGTLVGSVCHADPQGDWAAVMIALGGLDRRAGPGGATHDPGRAVRVGALPERAATRRGRDRGGGAARAGCGGRHLPQAGAPHRRLRDGRRRGGLGIRGDRAAAP